MGTRPRSVFSPVLVVVLSVALLAAPALAERGVTGDAIKLGVTSAFQGHAASLGSELYRGYMTYFAKVNESGGINGRRIEIVAYNDGYDPPLAVKNTIGLINQDKVFMLFGNVGTPTTVKVLPILLKYKNPPLYMFGPFTGAQPQREEPYATQVVNVRASYRQETAALVDFFAGKGKKRIAVFFQNDAYGRSGQNGVSRGLKARGLSIVKEATYTRGATFDHSMANQAKAIIDSGADAVVSIGAYQACAAFVRDARKAGFGGPIANISFVGSEALLELLLAQQRKDGTDYTRELYNSQVVPPFNDTSRSLVAQYRKDLKTYDIQIPAGLKDPNYVPAEYSFTSLEGYINAYVLTEVLKAAGPDLDSMSFMDSLMQMKNLDIGIGSPVQFEGMHDHQGLDRVYITQAVSGKWVLVR